MSDEKRKPTFRDVIARACDQAIIQTNGHTFVAERGEAILREFVEQREAKLCGALQAVRDMVRGAYDQSQADHPEFDSPLLRTMHLGNTLDVLAAAIDGAGPDYVPAEQLRAAEARVKAMAVAIDALDSERYANGEVIAAYLEANGLKKPGVRWWADIVTDEQIKAEVRRRGLGELDRRVCRELACNRIAVAGGRCGLHATEYDVASGAG